MPAKDLRHQAGCGYRGDQHFRTFSRGGGTAGHARICAHQTGALERARTVRFRIRRPKTAIECPAARQTSVEQLVKMVRSVCRPEDSEPHLANELPHAAESAPPEERALTTRERQVLKLLAEGKTVRGAATDLGLSSKTVDAHKFNLMRKLGIHNKAELVMWAIQKRVVKVPA